MATKTIGPTGDYTSLSTYATYVNALGTLAAPEIGEVQNTEIVIPNGTTVTFSGFTPSATNTWTLTAAPGASFRDNANKTKNPLRYNASNGAAISGSVTYSATIITVNVPYCIFSNLQIKAYNNFGQSESGITWGGNNATVDSCIIEFDGGHPANVAHGFYGSGTLVKDTLWIFNSGSSYLMECRATATFINCTFVEPSNLTPTGTALWLKSNVNFQVLNCVFSGFAADINWAYGAAVTAGTSTNNATDHSSFPTGLTGQTNLVPSTEFMNPDSIAGAMDWRLNYSSVKCRDNGTNTGTPTTDIIGQAIYNTTRDIGAWEYNPPTAPTVITTTMGFPNAAYPQSISTDTKTVQNYLYPGAIQPPLQGSTIVTPAISFPGAAFLQHKSTNDLTRSYFNAGAVQLKLAGGSSNYSKIISIASVSATSFLKAMGKLTSIASTSSTSFLKSIAKTVAIASTSTSSFIKSIAKTVSIASSSLVSIATSIGTGAVNHAQTILISSVSALSMLKSIAKSTTITSTSSLSSVKAISKAVPIGSTSATSFLKNVRKITQIASTSTSSFLKAIKKTLSIGSASSVQVLVGKAYNQLVSIASTSTSSFLKTIGKLTSIASISATTAPLKSTSKNVPITSSTSTSFKKAITRLVSIAGTTSLNLIKGAGFFKTIAISSTSAVSISIGKAYLVALNMATSSLTSLSKVTNFQRIISVASTSASSLVKSISKLMSLGSTSAVQTNKSMTKTLIMSTTSAVSAIKNIMKNFDITSTISTIIFNGKLYFVTIAASVASGVSFSKNIAKNVLTSVSSFLNLSQIASLSTVTVSHVSKRLKGLISSERKLLGKIRSIKSLLGTINTDEINNRT